MSPYKVYVASSWRNQYQSDVVGMLRSVGLDVYDFRNPRPGDDGFKWSEIDPDWENWTTKAYVEALKHPIAEAGFTSDMDALKEADATVLVLPSGRSAHLELGYAVGVGQRTAIVIPEKQEPELMVKMVNDILITTADIVRWGQDLAAMCCPSKYGHEWTCKANFR